MVWTNEQNMFAYYVIAKVESNCNYSSCNQNDPITLGIGQWFGNRAAKLLIKLKNESPDDFSKLSTRLQNDINATDQNEPPYSYWSNYWLRDDDATSWGEASQSDVSHRVQDEIFLTDIEGYKSTLGDMGVTMSDDVESVKRAIMFMSAYHQSPLECSHVLQAIGGNRTLEETYNGIMNNGILSRYKNRYNEIKKLLDEWDGTSAPPDFGQSDATYPEQATGSTQLQSVINYVELINRENIIIHGKMGSGNKLQCYWTGNNIWKPQRNASAPPAPSTGGGVTPGTPEDFVAMKKLWEDNASRWGYAQAPGRLDPPSSGISDCSACIWWAANAATNNKYSWLGTWTGGMVDTCKPVEGAVNGLHLNLDVMQPGDLVLCNWGGFNPTYDHVDWYWGDGVLWGAGSAPLPKKVSDNAASYYAEVGCSDILVLRFL